MNIFFREFLYTFPIFAYTYKKGLVGEQMKLFNNNKNVEDESYMLLKDNLEKTNLELQTAYTNMQNVTEPDLIDYYIYQTQAAQIRYQYLLNCAKKLEDS